MQASRHRYPYWVLSCSLSPCREISLLQYNVILSRFYWQPTVSALMPSFVRVSWQFPWRWNNCGQPLSLIMCLTPGPHRFHQPSEQEVRRVIRLNAIYNHCLHISSTSCVSGSRVKTGDYLFSENFGFEWRLNKNVWHHACKLVGPAEGYVWRSLAIRLDEFCISTLIFY